MTAAISMEGIAFFFLSTMVIGGAVFMIHFTKVVHMALALSFTFLGIAGLYALLQAPFLAVIQVLVYAGAVTILILFGIMLTGSSTTAPSERSWHPVISFIGVASLLVLLLGVIYQTPLSREKEVDSVTAADLGELTLTQYVIAFEAVSLLLLVALVGAILLARKEGGSS
ncbi:NADH-quinone oxidoreductase subunit J [Mechercharimyces sp. CAU 1602]|uniref:NADH-quinone oxidoreductase subunit J n=1 Tax=Mechercharimyces sp. CAU 1602 TaxID=2973933 RepID=UPI0021635AE5|nr:NADH-quinone oxidoreductase subunit J [Mechercharimyces sp. CAU 1602]MCS1352271.1 NADH-quinone oxidoreductase subunit J [Mechercharimyces sp. CAU 1602]